MMSHTAAMLLALATMTATPDRDVAALSYDQLAPGQTFEIRTVDQVFRGTLLDRATGECLVSTSPDGTSFDPPRSVYLLGATAGRQDRQMLVLMREVKVGLKMELGLGDLEEKHRQVTSEVKAIRLGP